MNENIAPCLEMGFTLCDICSWVTCDALHERLTINDFIFAKFFWFTLCTGNKSSYPWFDHKFKADVLRLDTSGNHCWQWLLQNLDSGSNLIYIADYVTSEW